MRIHYGLGSDLTDWVKVLIQVLVLCGGDKGSQRRDIVRARRLALDWS